MFLVVAFVTCTQAYDPPAIRANNQYLVVDGFINTGTNAVTVLNINRTRNLGDSTVTGIPELNAQVSILSSSGASWPLADTGHTGNYISQPLNLDQTRRYRIAITTSDNRKYSSDPVPVKPTPPIDSVFWLQPGDFTAYVRTHDPTNNTRYYRYDYLETWEHDAELTTPWTVVNGMIEAADSANQKSQCWTTDASTTVLLATSSALSQDVINSYPLITIPKGDPKINIGYSILVRQYALTADAYNYWLLIQKTTDNVGTLFDLQPSQLIGNIHCLTNPSEPVIGYAGASSMQQQRIYVTETFLTNWGHNSPVYGCDTLTVLSNPTNPLIYNYPDTFFAPWYFDINENLVLGSRFCLDCTLFGGINQRPSFWP